MIISLHFLFDQLFYILILFFFILSFFISFFCLFFFVTNALVYDCLNHMNVYDYDESNPSLNLKSYIKEKNKTDRKRFSFF